MYTFAGETAGAGDSSHGTCNGEATTGAEDGDGFAYALIGARDGDGFELIGANTGDGDGFAYTLIGANVGDGAGF